MPNRKVSREEKLIEMKKHLQQCYNEHCREEEKMLSGLAVREA